MKLEEIREQSFKVEFKDNKIIKFKKLHEDAVIPRKADDGSACYDLVSIDDAIVPARGRVLVHTGLSWDPNMNNVELQVRPRSGMAVKHGITVLNTPGTVDASYRGEICVILYNTSDTDYEVKKGDRVAQAKIDIVPEFIIEETDNLSSTSRGNGGFGHSGR